MKIEELKHKVKIIFEYPKDHVGYLNISREDLDKLHLRVFLKNGENIFVDDIKQITLSIKKRKEALRR